jgi:hypothetical protein
VGVSGLSVSVDAFCQQRTHSTRLAEIQQRGNETALDSLRMTGERKRGRKRGWGEEGGGKGKLVRLPRSGKERISCG